MILKKILLTLILCLIISSIRAQTNFHGEVVYKMTGFDDKRNDTTSGGTYRAIFSSRAIKLQRFSDRGEMIEEKILFLDSLKEMLVDYNNKTARQIWRYNKSDKTPTLLPWGTKNILRTGKSKIIAGLPTTLIRLTGTDTVLEGRVDLRASELYFRLPAQVRPNLLLEGLLLFHNHLMLQMTVTAARSPHSGIQYSAEKIISRPVNESEFIIPADFRLQEN